MQQDNKDTFWTIFVVVCAIVILACQIYAIAKVIQSNAYCDTTCYPTKCHSHLEWKNNEYAVCEGGNNLILKMIGK